MVKNLALGSGAQTRYRPAPATLGYTNAIGMGELIELYRVDIAYNGFIEMRLSEFCELLGTT